MGFEESPSFCIGILRIKMRLSPGECRKRAPPEKSLAKKRLLLYVYAKPGNIYSKVRAKIARCGPVNCSEMGAF
jgi:hypothetical protein